MTSTPEPVPQITDDRAGLALRALAEVTDPASVGELVEVTEPADGVRDLVFACRLPGYVGWRWTVSTAQPADDLPPTVLEVELLPGEGALVAPPWVPWAERLAEYRRTHPDDPEGPADESDEDDDDADDEDVLDDDADDALEIDGVEFEAAEDDDDADEDDADADDADEDDRTGAQDR